MTGRISKRERLMNLVAVLLAAREPVPFREIVGNVAGYDDPAAEEALEKRFDRDKVELRRLGIPVEYAGGDDGGKAGYVIPRERVFQQKVSFTPQETVLLAIAGRVGAAATGGGALEEALKSALRKLAVDLAGPDLPGEMDEVSVLRARPGDPRALGNITVLTQAVTANRCVRLAYEGVASGQRTLREVDPYGLGLAHGAWYLVGWCHLREAIRVFKVARIVGEVTFTARGDAGREFRVPAGFELEEHLGREAWDLGSSEPIRVRLRVDPGMATDGLLPAACRVSEDADGVILELEVRRPATFVDWVLSRAGAVSVLAPAEIRAAVASEAERLLERYGPGARPSGAEPGQTVEGTP
jgi:proteasome accessory factor B